MENEYKVIAGADVVSLFGGAPVERANLAFEQAKQTGALLPEEAPTVRSCAFRALGEALSHGAKEAGAAVIGVTASWFSSLAANPYVEERTQRATFLQRSHTLIDVGRGYLGLKGGIGTLTEISTVRSLQQTRYIPPRPFVPLSDRWQGLPSFCADRLVIQHSGFEHLRLASTPPEAVRPLAMSPGTKRL